ncbi:MAG: transglutaminase domain-containing protein [bacterium]|nr:transglutaminase domain-containing protein [bacterium]
MERQGESIPQKKGQQVKLSREMLFLAEQAAEGKLKVLPGKEWSLHYPVDSASRTEKLQGLLEGRYTAEEVAHDLKPDALFYDAEDIEKQGLETVSARVRDLSAFITHYDYPRFARFVQNMRGREIPLEELDRLYSDVTQARVQKKVMDSYGYTGQKQIESSLRNEASRIVEEVQSLPRSQKVLKALKANWLSEELGLLASEERDRIISELSGDERKVFEGLRDSYKEYVQRGDESAYKDLIKAVQEEFPKIQKQVESGKSSESMQELEKELEQYMEEAVPPGSPEDPAIPPDDSDEYHTPPSQSGESQEKMQERPIFEINPALGGYYASGRKSYFDIETKTWSKKKQLSSYSVSVKGKDRSTISGVLDSGIKSLPLPNGYTIDTASLKTKGAKVEVKRDQNGCFYLEVSGSGSFSVDFIPEKTPFAGATIPEDVISLYRGSLSPKTENAILKLIGMPVQKAEQARQHILANHFYPGGGDLQKAQALQYKLRTESTGDNYIQNLDQSEYLECYSANTKFIAMIRKAGVPARLVIGHKVEGAKDGKSAITQSTGHAWSEIWDGKEWRRFDATPNPKPEDKKEGEKDKDSKKESAPEAQDGGIDKPQEKSSEKQDSKKGKGEKGQKQDSGQKSESSNPTDQMSDASDSDMQQSESQLQQAKEQMEQMIQQKQQLDNKVEQAEKFKDLAELQKEVEESELLDDLKKELEDKLEAKEEQMKDKIKDELDQMVEDGFMDEKQRDKILEELEKKKLEELDRVQREVEQENRLYNEYEDIREEIMPLVDKWFKYFAERLPRQEEVGFDEDSLTRQGAFNRRAVMKSRNLLFGMVKNPREIRPSIKPRFMASILVDVSGSMAGEKLKSARKLLIFYSELFSCISEVFGYIKFSVDIFSDAVKELKGFKQDYDSPQRYDFDDGTVSTIKVRLMQQLNTHGGTNMLDGIKKAAAELNKQVEEYPDYASAFYFVGDGGDTYGNAANITRFLQLNESERGFGEHMYSAILLGNEAQRRELANIFGDEHTNVAPDFDELIEKSMDKFDEDLEEYLKTKTQ